MIARVVHCKRETFDVYIGRPSKWGNPIKLARGASYAARAQVLAYYEAWLREQPELMAALHELRGKVLGCWCAPKACHGDVLVRLANAWDGQPHPFAGDGCDCTTCGEGWCHYLHHKDGCTSHEGGGCEWCKP